MRQLTIACDFDDTLANFTGLWVDSYNALFPEKTALTHLDVNRYALKSVGNLTEDELQETFRLVRAQNYALKMYPVDKLFEHWFNKILRDGHRVYILTANPPEVLPKIEKWLACYGVLGIKAVSVKNIDEKMECDWDVIIDDSPQLIPLCEKTNRQHILYAALHNKAANKNAKRVALNWQNVYEHILEIADMEELPSDSVTSSPAA